MKFTAEHIELGHDDSWFLHGFGHEVGYDSLMELYWQVAGCLEEAVAYEFGTLAHAEESGATLYGALHNPNIANAYSTYLADKLVSLNSAICHFVEVEDILH